MNGEMNVIHEASNRHRFSHCVRYFSLRDLNILIKNRTVVISVLLLYCGKYSSSTLESFTGTFLL